MGITAIISSRFEEILRSSLKGLDKRLNIAVQEKHQGTADAVWCAIKQGCYPKPNEVDYIIVLMGDQPLVTSADLDQLIEEFDEKQPSRAGIMTFREDRTKPEFSKCGVVIRRKRRFYDLRPRIPVPRGTKTEELHAGPYIFEASWLKGLLVAFSKLQHYFMSEAPEFHLYVPLIGARSDTGVVTCRSRYPQDFLGVDTISALEEVRRRMKRRKAR